MCLAVSTSVVSMLKRMGKDDLAEDEDPGIFSWLTGELLQPVHLPIALVSTGHTPGHWTARNGCRWA